MVAEVLVDGIDVIGGEEVVDPEVVIEVTGVVVVGGEEVPSAD